MAKPIQRYLLVSIAAASIALSAAAPSAAAPEVLIDHVPAYYWYHGCGPTALGMIFGYYDLHGYDDLFPDVSGWDSVKQTAAVQHHLSSDAHNAYYENPGSSLLPNDGWKDDGGTHPPPGDPAPEATSIADYFQTSLDVPPAYVDNTDGASPVTVAPEAVAGSYRMLPAGGFEYLPGFAGSRGYMFEATNALPLFGFPGTDTLPPPNEIVWADVKTHIDAGRPLLFVVKTPAGFPNQPPDHYVTVIGYDDNRGGQGRHFAFLDAYHEDESDPDSVSWAKWQDAGNDWGVSNITFIKPQMQLVHAVALLQTLTGIPIPGGSSPLQVVPDIDADGRKSLPELVYVLQETAGLRPFYPTAPYFE